MRETKMSLSRVKTADHMSLLNKRLVQHTQCCGVWLGLT